MEKREKPKESSKRETATEGERERKHAGNNTQIPRGNKQLSRSGRRRCRCCSCSCCRWAKWVIASAHGCPSPVLPLPLSLLVVPFCEVIKCQNRLAGAMVNEVDLAARHSAASPPYCLSLPSPAEQLTNLPELSGTRGVYVLFSVQCTYNFVIVCNI